MAKRRFYLNSCSVAGASEKVHSSTQNRATKRHFDFKRTCARIAAWERARDQLQLPRRPMLWIGVNWSRHAVIIPSVIAKVNCHRKSTIPSAIALTIFGGHMVCHNDTCFLQRKI